MEALKQVARKGFKICPICGTEFRIQGRKIYCSETCYDIHKKDYVKENRERLRLQKREWKKRNKKKTADCNNKYKKKENDKTRVISLENNKYRKLWSIEDTLKMFVLAEETNTTWKEIAKILCRTIKACMRKYLREKEIRREQLKDNNIIVLLTKEKKLKDSKKR